MTFRVSAVQLDTILSATRLLPASALVLAIRWAEMGASNVTITDAESRSYSIASFRAFLYPQRPPARFKRFAKRSTAG